MELSFATTTVNRGTSYWLTIDVIGDWGRAAQVGSRLTRAGELELKTGNVQGFTVDLGLLSRRSLPDELVIDGGSRIPLKPVRSQRLHLFLKDGGWRVGSVEDPKIKVKGLCGPAEDIEQRQITLVYGTLNPGRSWFLKERAFKIMTDLIGTNSGEMHGGRFEIKSDREIDSKSAHSGNLWLLGGPEENAVAAAMDRKLPIRIDDGAVSMDGRSIKDPDLLLSYIYPNPNSPGHYVYLEEGTSILAYYADVLACPRSDACVQQVSPSRSRILWQGDFNTAWRLSK